MGRILDLSERIILILLFAALANSALRSPQHANLLLILTEGMSVFFVIIRKQTLDVSTLPLDWALALLGTMLPLLVRPHGEPLVPGYVATAIMSVGALITLAAKLSLNRRFGIAPANRGVQRAWAYSIVRHPMYAGYIVVQCGFLLLNPTLWNLGLYLVAWGIQVGRIVREERWLSQDPAYRAYAEAVRFRLIPGLF
jgi:protein-S-isoprenylcysteine O-methyltransferase Ste14